MSQDLLAFLACVGLFCLFIVGDMIGRYVSARKKNPIGGLIRRGSRG